MTRRTSLVVVVVVVVVFWCCFAPGKGAKNGLFWADWIFSAAGTCRRLHKKKKKTEFNSKNDEDFKNTITFGVGHG